MEWLVGKGKGVDVCARDKQQMTPLHAAAKNKQLHTMKWLVEHGADLMAVGNDGVAPLHCSAANSHFIGLGWFASQGADFSLPTMCGNTVLQYTQYSVAFCSKNSGLRVHPLQAHAGPCGAMRGHAGPCGPMRAQHAGPCEPMRGCLFPRHGQQHMILYAIPLFPASSNFEGWEERSKLGP
jgi:hypothetical protein